MEDDINMKDEDDEISISSDSMDEFLPRAFDIGDCDDDKELDFNEEPLTGEEYLRLVRYAAKRCPKVAVADIDLTKLAPSLRRPSSTYFTPPPKMATCDPQLLPSLEWETQFLESFSHHRQRLSFTISNTPYNESNQIKLPHINDKRLWFLYCFGKDQNDNDINNNNLKGNQPTLQLFQQLDHVLIVQLIFYHIEWLENRELSNERSSWLYSLLSLLEKPIDGDTSANLRSMLRRLAILRSKIIDKNDQNLPSINILITIIGKYFNQIESD